MKKPNKTKKANSKENPQNNLPINQNRQHIVSIPLETAKIEAPAPQRTGNTRAARLKFELEKGGVDILTAHEIAEKAWNLAHAYYNINVGTKEDTVSIIEDDIEFLIKRNLSISSAPNPQQISQSSSTTTIVNETNNSESEVFNEEDVPELSVVNLRGILSTMEQYGMENGYVGFYGDDCHFFSAPMHGCVAITKEYVKKMLGYE